MNYRDVDVLYKLLIEFHRSLKFNPMLRDRSWEVADVISMLEEIR